MEIPDVPANPKKDNEDDNLDEDSDEDLDLIRMEHEQSIKTVYMDYLMEMIEKLQIPEDVEVNGLQILNLLDEVGQETMEDHPSILLSLVTKACLLIQSDHYMEIVWKIVEMLRNSDKLGNTSLMYLLCQISMDGYKTVQEYPEKVVSLIQALISLEESPASFNVQTHTGENILHFLAKIVMLKPEIGYDLLDVFRSVTTKKNVNTLDQNSVTPYTYILLRTRGSGRIDTEIIFLTIEKIFLRNGASVDHASPGMTAVVTWELQKILEKLETPDDLISSGHRMLKVIQEDVPGNVDTITMALTLTEMIKKAPVMIESTYYMDIIQEIMKIYKDCSCKPDGKPVMCLMQQFVSNAQKFIHFQSKLISLLQELLSVDDSLDSRSLCWRKLIFHARYTSPQDHQDPACLFQWTDQFINILQQLLNEGADPTIISELPSCIPSAANRNIPYSAQWRFFEAIMVILANETSDVVTKVIELVPFFLTERSLYHLEPHGTVLHALISSQGKWFDRNVPQDILLQYVEFVSMIIAVNPAVVDMTDDYGRNPLELFLLTMKLTAHQDFFTIVEDLVELLMPRNSGNCLDVKSWSVIDYLTKELSKTSQQEVSENGESMFLQLIKTFATQDNLKRCSMSHLSLAFNRKPNLRVGILETLHTLLLRNAANNPSTNSLTSFCRILRTESDFLENEELDISCEGGKICLMGKHFDIEFHEIRCNILEDIPSEERPMLNMSESAVEAVGEELRTIFELAIQETKFADSVTEISISGSVKEKLEVDNLEYLDIHIKFGAVEDESEFRAKLEYSLLVGLCHSTWKGVYLRSVTIGSPWTFVKEETNSCWTVSVNVMAMTVCEKNLKMADPLD